MATRQEYEDLLKRLNRVEEYNLTGDQAAQVSRLREQINSEIQNIEIENVMTEIAQRVKNLETAVATMHGNNKQKLQNVVDDIKDTMEVYREMRTEEDAQYAESGTEKIGLMNHLKQKLASIRQEIRDYIEVYQSFDDELKEELNEKPATEKSNSKGLIDILKEKVEEIKARLEVAREMTESEELAEREQGQVKPEPRDYDYNMERTFDALHHYGM